MHVLRSLSIVGVLTIGAAGAAMPDDPHNVTPQLRKHIAAVLNAVIPDLLLLHLKT
jgi:hypothetical protein